MIDVRYLSWLIDIHVITPRPAYSGIGAPGLMSVDYRYGGKRAHDDEIEIGRS